MNIKALVAAVVASVGIFLPSGAFASSEGIIELVESIERAGVEVRFNRKQDCFSTNGQRYDGFYAPHQRVIAICQDKVVEYNGELVEFTDNDFDTIRHEAHHLVQDCLDGEIDGNMKLLFTGDARSQFLGNWGWDKAEWVREVYSDVSEELILLEQEAFSTAATVSADVIADAVREKCPLN